MLKDSPKVERESLCQDLSGKFGERVYKSSEFIAPEFFLSIDP
jgi:hypothetical protein